MAHILIVDDDTSIRLSLSVLLKRSGYTTSGASNAAEALLKVRESMHVTHEAPKIDLILMDMNYTSSTTGKDGLELLMKVRILLPEVPVILMTAWGSIPLAVEGVKNGAVDFVTKPWDNRDILRRIETALSLNESQERNGEDNVMPHNGFEGVIGESPALKAVLETVRKIAPTEAPVLITGENGTGKELIARAIHRLSRRAGKSFVPVNLGGLPQSLFESEMFGYVKGAFTGADRDRAGRFETADSGTIFLDEIGDLDASCQVKLLRVLQEHTFERLGESRPRRVDIRVVCATNIDLPTAVARGDFREDLFYRINLIMLHIPPLRERREDIPALVRHIAGPEFTFTSGAMTQLCAHNYPGNIRELQNIVRRLTLVSGHYMITEEDVRSSLSVHNPESNAITSLSKTPGAMTLGEIERQAIMDAIKRADGNLSQVAAVLGITRQSLYRRMEKFGIKP